MYIPILSILLLTTLFRYITSECIFQSSQFFFSQLCLDITSECIFQSSQFFFSQLCLDILLPNVYSNPLNSSSHNFVQILLPNVYSNPLNSSSHNFVQIYYFRMYIPILSILLLTTLFRYITSECIFQSSQFFFPQLCLDILLPNVYSNPLNSSSHNFVQIYYFRMYIPILSILLLTTLFRYITSECIFQSSQFFFPQLCLDILLPNVYSNPLNSSSHNFVQILLPNVYSNPLNSSSHNFVQIYYFRMYIPILSILLLTTLFRYITSECIFQSSQFFFSQLCLDILLPNVYSNPLNSSSHNFVQIYYFRMYIPILSILLLTTLFRYITSECIFQSSQFFFSQLCLDILLPNVYSNSSQFFFSQLCLDITSECIFQSSQFFFSQLCLDILLPNVYSNPLNSSSHNFVQIYYFRMYIPILSILLLTTLFRYITSECIFQSSQFFFSQLCLDILLLNVYSNPLNSSSHNFVQIYYFRMYIPILSILLLTTLFRYITSECIFQSSQFFFSQLCLDITSECIFQSSQFFFSQLCLDILLPNVYSNPLNSSSHNFVQIYYFRMYIPILSILLLTTLFRYITSECIFQSSQFFFSQLCLDITSECIFQSSQFFFSQLCLDILLPNVYSNPLNFSSHNFVQIYYFRMYIPILSILLPTTLFRYITSECIFQSSQFFFSQLCLDILLPNVYSNPLQFFFSQLCLDILLPNVYSNPLNSSSHNFVQIYYFRMYIPILSILLPTTLFRYITSECIFQSSQFFFSQLCLDILLPNVYSNPLNSSSHNFVQIYYFRMYIPILSILLLTTLFRYITSECIFQSSQFFFSQLCLDILLPNVYSNPLNSSSHNFVQIYYFRMYIPILSILLLTTLFRYITSECIFQSSQFFFSQLCLDILLPNVYSNPLNSSSHNFVQIYYFRMYIPILSILLLTTLFRYITSECIFQSSQFFFSQLCLDILLPNVYSNPLNSSSHNFVQIYYFRMYIPILSILLLTTLFRYINFRMYIPILSILLLTTLFRYITSECIFQSSQFFFSQLCLDILLPNVYSNPLNSSSHNFVQIYYFRMYIPILSILLLTTLFRYITSECIFQSSQFFFSQLCLDILLPNVYGYRHLWRVAWFNGFYQYC